MEKIKIIAEIGSVHDGSFGNAKCLIKAASECGADAVKFQTHLADAETLKDAPSPSYFKDESRWDYFKRTAFTFEQYRLLKEYSEKDCQVEFISSPFSSEAVDFLEALGLSTYKIPSGEITNLPLLKKVAQTGKNIILSSGMSSWQELDDAIDTLKNNNCGNLSIMQCTSEYPCPPRNSGINLLKEMKNRYQIPIGFSDHTAGITMPVMAATLGASSIEKHFTLSKKMYGSDAKHSSEPDEFKAFADAIRIVECVFSNPVDKDAMAASLAEMKKTFEKSIIINGDIKKGHILKESDLSFKKPGDGISANQYENVIGIKTKVDISAQTKLTWEMLENKS